MADVKLCKLCEKETHKYLCPKCGIEYCSLACYKSEKHWECSESFYKQCIEEELRIDQVDPQTRNKMLEALKRLHDQQQNDIEDIEDLAQMGLDSDDEEEVPDLSERLQNVDLDDADSVWEKLTDSEKQEFEALLRNGDMQKLLPPWEPWWSYRAESKLVEDLSKTSETFNYREKCPRVIEIKAYDQISKVKPAECVRHNVLNVLHAYAFTALYFNGDHRDFAREAASLLLHLSNNLRENEVFVEADLAVESVYQQAMNCRLLVADSENISSAKSACICILRGPDDSDKCFYLKAAFSDAHNLLSQAKMLGKEKERSKSADKEFARRFPDQSPILTTQISRDKIRLYLKKIEYYLSWIQSYAARDLYD